MIAVLTSATFFGCVSVIAIQISRAVCAGVVPADDGPRSGRPPYAVLVGGSAVVGGLLLATGTTPLQLGTAAIVLFALVACWCSDTTCGIVPDVFTLAPLAALLLFAFAQREWGVAFSASIPFAPFAAAALFSRGYGMGWGDAKLAALAGAAIGAPLAVVSLCGACIAAAIGYRLARKRHRPIAFAPYIAAATAIALPLGLAR